MLPDQYLDVRTALGAGYQVILVQPRQTQVQVLFDCAKDVTAAARLFNLAVLTNDNEVRALCRAMGVRLLNDRNEELWR